MSAARVPRVGWQSFRPRFAASASAAGLRPPAPRQGKRGLGTLVPEFSWGRAGAKTPVKARNRTRKIGYQTKLRGGGVGVNLGARCPPSAPSRAHSILAKWGTCSTASSWVGVQPINKNTSLVWYPFVRFPLSLAALRLPGCCLAAPWPPWLLPGCFRAAPCTGQLQDNYRTTTGQPTGQLQDNLLLL